MTADPFEQLLHRQEAFEKATTEKNDFIRAMMKQALHTAHRVTIDTAASKGRVPAAPFDLDFFVEVIREVATHREILERFMAGDFLDDAGEPI